MSHPDPQLHLIFTFFLIFICLCLDPELSAGVI